VPIVEEWTAWLLVRERERQLKRKELIREAEAAQRRVDQVRRLRPRRREAAERASRHRRAA